VDRCKTSELTLNLKYAWLKVSQSGKKCEVNTKFLWGNFLDSNCIETLMRCWELIPFSVVVTILFAFTFEACTF
jgi:hypothetical protein